MTSPTPASRPRRAVLDVVAGIVAGMVPGPAHTDCVRVAVDGVDGSGKSTFADELAVTLRAEGRPVVRVSADGFHHRRVVRYRRGRHCAEGFWLDSYDYASLRTSVLDPLGPGGSRWYRPAVHDVRSDAVLDLPPRRAAPGSVLVLDGLFLHRDELFGRWDLSVWLEVPFAVTAARMARRDGSNPDPTHPSMARYVEGQRLYFRACTPWRRADLVIDNEVPERPRLLSVRASSADGAAR